MTMWILISLGIFLTLILNYVLWFRQWLKTRPWPWSQRYFDFIEPLEILFYKKSETILLARALQGIGVLSAFLTWYGALDFSQMAALIPERWQPWVLASPFIATTVLGIVNEINRRYTTEPLAVTELPTQGKSPEVEAAVANLEVAKTTVTAAVKVDAEIKAEAAKANGTK